MNSVSCDRDRYQNNSPRQLKGLPRLSDRLSLDLRVFDLEADAGNLSIRALGRYNGRTVCEDALKHGNHCVVERSIFVR